MNDNEAYLCISTYGSPVFKNGREIKGITENYIITSEEFAPGEGSGKKAFCDILEKSGVTFNTTGIILTPPRQDPSILPYTYIVMPINQLLKK